MAKESKRGKKKLRHPRIHCVICGAPLSGNGITKKCYCDTCRVENSLYDEYALDNLLPVQTSILAAAIIGQLATDHRYAIQKWRQCNDEIEKYQAWCTVRAYHHTWRTQWIGLMLGNLDANVIISSIEGNIYGRDSGFSYAGNPNSVRDFQNHIVNVY